MTAPNNKTAARRALRIGFRIFLVLGAVLIVAAVAGGFWFRSQLRASLPQLDGEHSLVGAEAPITVTRDRLGVPKIQAANREDVARALGFLHAQDRFFQMDLSRRLAAGELAALFGAGVLPVDKKNRIHRFREEARQAVSLLKPAQRALLEAYATGVNAGLHALGARPFEYIVLRQAPEEWGPEDSLLTVLSMFMALQQSDGAYETTLATMHDVLPERMFQFMAPRGTEWDAPLAGPAFGTPAIPGAEVYDLRTRRSGKPTVVPVRRRETAMLSAPPAENVAVGSNNWAIAGMSNSNGSSLLANDMHLQIRVPNTWYRSALEWLDPVANGGKRQVSGLTLPGMPLVVVGSNAEVAWGFTNAFSDASDIVLLQTDEAKKRYRTREGWRDFQRHEETLKVAGRPAETLEVLWTIWGPLIEPDYHGRMRAYSWVAHSAEQLARSMESLENAHNIEEAIDIANGNGAPALNLVAADRTGRVAWTIYGSLPRRVGFDGQLPESWADGVRYWSGWLDKKEYPRIVDPESGRIWTANARVADGESLDKIGDGGYEIGARASIIRKRLAAKAAFTPRDFLEIQLDTSADFLERWRGLILDTLTTNVVQGRSQRAAFRQLVSDSWSGQALPDSTGYWLTRAFRDRVAERVFAFALSECYEADKSFDYTGVRRSEGPLWKMVNEKPLHLLDPQFSSWDALLLEAIDKVIDETGTGTRLSPPPAYRNPFSTALPFVGRWLDMPRLPIPGDVFTVRMQFGSVGASMRMVVSPGRENEGIMEMPTGQSGHPLSPFYANSHDAWVKGEPSAFLPGPAEHTLKLLPAAPAF